MSAFRGHSRSVKVGQSSSVLTRAPGVALGRGLDELGLAAQFQANPLTSLEVEARQILQVAGDSLEDRSTLRNPCHRAGPAALAAGSLVSIVYAPSRPCPQPGMAAVTDALLGASLHIVGALHSGARPAHRVAPEDRLGCRRACTPSRPAICQIGPSSAVSGRSWS